MREEIAHVRALDEILLTLNRNKLIATVPC